MIFFKIYLCKLIKNCKYDKIIWQLILPITKTYVTYFLGIIEIQFKFLFSLSSQKNILHSTVSSLQYRLTHDLALKGLFTPISQHFFWLDKESWNLFCISFISKKHATHVSVIGSINCQIILLHLVLLFQHSRQLHY